MEREDVRRAVEAGEIGPDDKLSLGAGLPKVFWEFGPFRDLEPAPEALAPPTRAGGTGRGADAVDARGGQAPSSGAPPAGPNARPTVVPGPAAGAGRSARDAGDEPAASAVIRPSRRAEKSAPSQAPGTSGERPPQARAIATPFEVPEGRAPEQSTPEERAPEGSAQLRRPSRRAAPEESVAKGDAEARTGGRSVTSDGPPESAADRRRRRAAVERALRDAARPTPRRGASRAGSSSRSVEAVSEPEPAGNAPLAEPARGADPSDESAAANPAAGASGRPAAGAPSRADDAAGGSEAVEFEPVVETDTSAAEAPLSESAARAAARSEEFDDGRVYAEIERGRAPSPFSAELLALSGIELRTRLLSMPLEHILGVSLAEARPAVIRALGTRRASLEGHRDTNSALTPQKLAIADCLRILQMTFEVARSPRDVRSYHTASREAGRPVRFGEFVEFERSLHDPRVLDRALARNRGEGTQSVSEDAKRSNEMSASDRVLADAEAYVREVESRSISDSTSSEPLQRSKPRGLRGLSSSLAVADPAGWKGTPTSGDLVYGVGDGRSGLASVLPPWLLVFLVPVLLIPTSRLDTFEARSEGFPVLQLIRAVLMVCCTVGVVRYARGESVRRLGMSPLVGPTLVALLGGALLAGLAYVAVPFEVHAESAAGVVIAVVVMRALTEALFFEGLIARTLFIEFERPGGAIALSVALYGIYLNSYRFFWDPAETPPTAGVLRYAVLIGLPAAYACFTTRSWIPAFWVRACAMLAAALAAMHAAGAS